MVAAAEVQTGAMVAALPAAGHAARLAVGGGEPAEQLHMTGLYLGDAADWTPEEQAALVEAARAYAATVEPFTADGFALSLFNPDKPDVDTCVVLGLSGDAVAEFHAGLDAAFEPFAECMPEQREPRVAHLTLQYTDDPGVVETLLNRCGPVVFDRLRVAFAGSNIDIPFGRVDNQAMTAAVGDEILLEPAEDVVPDLPDGTPFHGVIAPEGVWSGDGRQFAPGSLEWAPLPLALKWQPEEDDGHDGSVIVGRMDEIWRDEASLINVRGVMDDSGLYGAEALRLMRLRMLRGVSIRGDNTFEEDVELIYPAPALLPMELPGDGYAIQVPDAEPTVEELPPIVIEPMPPEPVGEPKVIVHKGRIRSATLCAEQAFIEAEIILDEMAEPPEAADMPTPPPGPTVVTAAAYTITIPELWPEWWFDEPRERPPFGALHITPEGRVFGLLAPGDVAHRAFRASGRNVKAPRGIDYSEFNNKPALVAGGDGDVYRINAGTITFDCGHPSPHDPRRADPRWAMQQYDNSCSVAARVRAGEYADGSGTWVAGALLHGIDADTVERMMACALSVDVQGGKLNAALLVPVEGFPAAVTSSVRVREGAMVASSMPIRLTPGYGSTADLRATLERTARTIGRDSATRFAALRRKVKGGE
jgi:hypothetical protein